MRVASQNRIAECQKREAAKEREHAKEVIKRITKLNSEYSKEYEAAVTEVMRKLRDENIYLISDKEVTDDQMAFIRAYYEEKLSGLIIPVWFSSIKQLDYETDESIYLAVRLTNTGRKSALPMIMLFSNCR